jgi:hypothetical protein
MPWLTEESYSRHHSFSRALTSFVAHYTIALKIVGAGSQSVFDTISLSNLKKEDLHRYQVYHCLVVSSGFQHAAATLVHVNQKKNEKTVCDFDVAARHNLATWLYRRVWSPLAI